jgi:dihydropteroate synthase
MLQKLPCSGKTLDLTSPAVMGILNVTPDSFSDGGLFLSIDKALIHARRMAKAGASIIDVGGESTRPGATAVSADEELSRVIPIVEALKSEINVIISIDTSKPEVMSEAVRTGAGLINDVRALREPGALTAARAANVPICLMHMQGEPRSMQAAPQYADVVVEVNEFLSKRVNACLKAGISANNLIIDPGFGFGKTLSNNLTLLNHLDHFLDFDLPLMVGLSRKSMIGALTDRPVDQRISGSVAAAVIAAGRGAHIFRVHDVEQTVDALKINSAVNKAK